MNNMGTTLLKSIGCGFLGWGVVALVMCIRGDDLTFVQALGNSESILGGVAALVGTFIGYRMRAKR